MRTRYKTIILGAGFHACGLALHLEDCLLIEPEIAIGSDFVFGFGGTDCPKTPPGKWHPLVRSLFRDLQNRKALQNGRLHPGGLLPVFSELMRERNLRIMLSTSIYKVGANKVIVQNTDGRLELYADRVVDARPRGQPRLSAAIQLESSVAEGRYGDMILRRGPLVGEAFVIIPLPRNCSWPTARQMLKNAWESRPPSLREARFLLSAARFCRSPFENPFEALQAGLEGVLPERAAAAGHPPTSLKSEYDLIVAGLGTAGSIAAIAAARSGLKVLALERNTYPGGTQTGGFIHGFYIQKPTGLTAEIAAEIDRLCAKGVLGGQQIENRKLLLEEKLNQLGVELRYGAVVTDIRIEGETVKGADWLEGDRHYGAAAPVVVDATAEAELAVMAGLPTSKGRESDSQFQPFTYSFAVQTEDNTICWNFDAGCVDQTSARELSDTLLECPAIHLRDDYSALPRRLLLPSDLPGIREGVHVVGRSSVKFSDFRDPSGFDDTETIDYVFSNLDSHAKDFALESENYRDWIVAASLWGAEIVIPVPLGAILPRGISGLIAAGRHLDVDHDLGHAVRMNAGMGRLGECAGVLAALAKRHSKAPHEIPYEWLRRETPTTTTVPLSLNLRYSHLEEDEIIQALAGDSPGRAIWVARQPRWRPLMLDCLRAPGSGNLNLRRHAAIALALARDPAALPELRACVKERDSFIPRTSRKENHCRGYAAVYLLGALRDTESIDLLAECLFHNEGEHLFHYHSYAFSALINIGENEPAFRVGIGEILRERAEDPEWFLDAAMHLTSNRRRFDLLYRIHIAAALRRWGVDNRIWEKIPWEQLSPNDAGVARELGVRD